MARPLIFLPGWICALNLLDKDVELFGGGSAIGQGNRGGVVLAIADLRIH